MIGGSREDGYDDKLGMEFRLVSKDTEGRIGI